MQDFMRAKPCAGRIEREWRSRESKRVSGTEALPSCFLGYQCGWNTSKLQGGSSRKGAHNYVCLSVARQLRSSAVGLNSSSCLLKLNCHVFRLLTLTDWIIVVVVDGTYQYRQNRQSLLVQDFLPRQHHVLSILVLLSSPRL